MEFLALVYGDPDTWESLSEEERSSGIRGLRGRLARRRGRRRARRRERARVDRGRDERAGAQRRRGRHRRALRRGEGVARRVLPALVRHDRGRDRLGGEDPGRLDGGAIEIRPVHASRGRRRHEVRTARLQRPVHRGSSSPRRRPRPPAQESMPRWITLFDEMGKADPNMAGTRVVGRVGGEGRARRRRRDDRHRRPVRRDEGAARRRLHHRPARPGRGDPDRRARPGGGVRDARDPAVVVR